MKILIPLILIVCMACTRQEVRLLSDADLTFLKDLTHDVVDSARILPGQDLPPAIRAFGPNNSGITLIKPGGRDCYPSFWIRDYGMSLESNLVTKKEQLDILLYTAARQSDSTWTTKTGSLVPKGSIPDHIRINDGLPVYFPGTYDYVNQGAELWRTPPYCDQFYFIHMAWFYLNKVSDYRILNEEINGIRLYDRLLLAFREVPVDRATGLVVIYDSLPTCDFGFRDVVSMTGKVCFGSILRSRAAAELAELAHKAGNKRDSEEFKAAAGMIRKNLAPVFADGRGMLRASTGKSRQADVWATAFAVYTGILDGDAAVRACEVLAKAYRDGTMAKDGQIRHVLTTDDFSAATAWEKAWAGKNRYQNGAYWGTPTGWVCRAIARVDVAAARKLAAEFVAHLRKADFRVKGPDSGGPWEWTFPSDGYHQNPVYMTTVTCPLAAFK